MGRIERFEDLIAWQKTRVIAKEVYELTRKPPFAKDFGLCGQIQRAVVSILSNIAEGFERGGRAGFHKFLVVAMASCAEVRPILYIALNIGYINSEDFNKVNDLALEVGRITEVWGHLSKNRR
ncbi:MAG: four helix bundle protein [Candidatus Brocadiales bacterium]|nr:four helix bundle protein [Candidatus Brocadiales bacterium]